MFEQNNVLEFSLMFLPALVYASLIYLASPPFSIKWKMASFYFLMGILSTFFVTSVQYIFPSWSSHVGSGYFLSVFIHAFVQVALLEELCKLVSFKLAENYRRWKMDHPAGTMFYAMSVSCGFAFAENMLYVQTMGSEVLLVRSFSAVLTHMICGLMMGYFVSLSRLEGDLQNSMNVFGKEFSGFFHSLAALLCASFFHGLYDFMLMTGGSMTQAFMLIGAGILITYTMSKQMFRKLRS